MMGCLCFLGLALSAAVGWNAPAPQTTRTEQLLDTVVGPGVEVRVPPTAENIGRTLATVAKVTGVLIGFEAALEDPTFGSDHFAWSPRGITLAQALDQIVAMDSRYEWRERAGVIHVRPKAAFEDPAHFVNARVDRFELKDALPLHATFEVHRVYRPACDIRHPIYTSEREQYLSDEPPAMRMPVTVSLTNVTVLDVLDAVVKAHGQLYWNISYRVPADVTTPEAKYEYAIFSFNDRPALGGWWRMCAGDEHRFPG